MVERTVTEDPVLSVYAPPAWQINPHPLCFSNPRNPEPLQQSENAGPFSYPKIQDPFSS